MEPTDFTQVLNRHEQVSKGSVESFKKELHKVRSGRASTGLLEGLMVDYYGTRTALQHLGQLSTPEARLIVIQVYDAKAAPAIEKAIQASDLGLNPAREGNTIRVSVPTLTEDGRKEIVRLLHKMAEDHRVSVRNHRREANEQLKKLEKAGDITKDDTKRALDKIQQQTDAQILEIDKALKAKEAEVLEV